MFRAGSVQPGKAFEKRSIQRHERNLKIPPCEDW